MTEKDYIRSLLRKSLEADLEADEYAALEAWAARHPANRDLLDRCLSGRFVDDLKDFHQGSGLVEKTYDYVVANSSAPVVKRQRWLPRRGLPYAAAVLLMAATAVWFFRGDRITPPSNSTTEKAAAIAPAGNRATLRLADGRTIALNEAQSGIVVGDGIMYLDGSAVLSEEIQGSETQQDSPTGKFTTHDLQLTTPKGGTYQVTLPDGTRVWLNAGSTLRYPSRFSKTERVVEFEGEGYFSVARMENKPFRVISNGQQLEVLGTEFNLLAYGDEQLIKTTLVKGSVRVTTTAAGGPASFVLAPGEQSSVADHGKLTKTPANLEKELAWKAGLFYFEKTSLDELLRQVSRWYDVTVRYEGKVPEESFSGFMSRDVTLATLLDYLSESAIAFKLENKTLTVKSTRH